MKDIEVNCGNIWKQLENNWKQWKTPQQRRLSLYTDTERTKAAEIEQQAKEIEQQRTGRQTELIEQVLERELAKLPAEVQEMARQARATDAKQRTDEQKALLKKYPSINVSAGSLYLYDKQAADELKELADKAKQTRESKPEERFVRALHEELREAPPETFLFTRGDIDQPGESLSPAELTVLCEPTTSVPENAPELTSTGRRLAYARWLTGGEHPLVARVLANRIWMHHFGRGLVATPGDFGFLGERPSHPLLLDWLAHQLVEHNWSAKELHRLILTSRVYRQQPQQVGPASEVDAENRLYWRKPVRRIEAEVFRDALLLFRGQLNERAFGPAVPVMADRVGQFVIGIENLNAGRPGPVIPMQGEEFRRSVYIQVRRSRPLSLMDPFDLPRQDPNCVARPSSTVSPQSLVLMNNQFVLESGRAMARRLSREAPDDVRGQLDRAWEIVYSRRPSDEEVEKALKFLQLQTEIFGSKSPSKEKQDSAELEALGSLCHALISSNELLYVD